MSFHADVPSFGPPLPKNPLFFKSREFRDFLLAKIVNADSVGNKIGIFTQIRMNTRKYALEDLVEKYSTKFTLDNCGNGFANGGGGLAHKLHLFNFGSIKPRKTRSKSLQMFNGSLLDSNNDNDTNHMNDIDIDMLAYSQSKLNGALFWHIEFIEDFHYTIKDKAYLGISRQYVVVVDPECKCVLFAIGCQAVIGWTIDEAVNKFMLYFDLGECVSIRLKTRGELNCVIRRLEYFTKGCRVRDFLFLFPSRCI